MENWRAQVLKHTSKLEHAFDKARLRFKEKFGLLDDIIIQPYTGFGNQEKITMTGRVLEKEGLDTPEEDASLWDNIRTLYHRYESDEVPQAPIAYQFQDQHGQLQTDDEGYFRLQIPNQQQLTGWQSVSFRLLKQYKAGQAPVHAQGRVLLRSSESSFGIISDLDDTIIVSQATNFFEKSRILLLNNERTRKPFAGVAAFYQALQKGLDQQRNNPVFYLSSASWNLWDMFYNFCQFNGLPEGVFLLREVGLDKNKFYKTSHGDHKLKNIRKVLDTFSLPFVLIGDSGQNDPEIYEEIVRDYPKRILAVYIRDIHPEENKPRDEEVKNIAAQVENLGVPLVLVRNSLEAARHAADLELIPRTALGAIEEETLEEEAEAEDFNKTLGLHRIFGKD